MVRDVAEADRDRRGSGNRAAALEVLRHAIEMLWMMVYYLRHADGQFNAMPAREVRKMRRQLHVQDSRF